MKNVVRIVLMALLVINIGILAQPRGVIKTEAVTGVTLTKLGLTTNSVSSGLKVVPNLTYVYLSPINFGNNDTVQTVTFTITSKPGGSVSELTTFGSKWAYFKPDVKGSYVLSMHMVTATGSHDTTATIVSSDFVGVGNFVGVPGSFPKCMTCHAANPTFVAIYNNWKVSGHANIFNEQLSTSTHYSTSCMKCHTTGYNYNNPVDNNGFDDIASDLGWTFTGQSSPAKWDSLVTYFPDLVNHATIGCEMCHGAGSQHATTGNPANIQISSAYGVCAQCHDAPTHHTKVQEYENSLHSRITVHASSSTAPPYTLANCNRCHDGQGFINFTKGVATVLPINRANHKVIGCATCHDPHGNGQMFSLRQTPAGSDTLANGYQYTRGGLGMICMNCHKARRVYDPTATPSPHQPQTEAFLGQGAVPFDGTPFQTSSHSYAITDGCVTCHMAPTDTNAVNLSKVGGHSWNMVNHENGFNNTSGCVNCHGPKTSFADFIATSDYDADGTVEPVQNEVDGLLQKVRIQLPPVGQDTIITSQITTATLRKAYWNYRIILSDLSRGMHNTKYAVDVLVKSLIAAGGSVPVELVSFSAKANGSSVSLTWLTATENNNKGFTVERKVNGSWANAGFISGKGTTTLPTNYSFVDNVKSINGKVSYRLRQVDFDGTSHLSKEVEVNINSTPSTYSLNQNFPNPFNPSTMISFNLPFQSKVKVTIYNIAGEVVRVLVNGDLAAGTHEVKFDTKGTSVASGIYFYSIEATSGSKSFKETKKMMLLK